MSKKTVHDADEIINRHILRMLEELHEGGYDAKGVVACVVGGSGKPTELDTNVALGMIAPVFNVGPEDQLDELLAFAWATLQVEIEKAKAH